jgi:2-hydroxy-3-oxopropionate reductase
VAAALAERGIGFLDAPVSGGEQGAIDATLSFMVGGDVHAFDRVRPLLEAMGSSVVHVGDVGAGEVAKLVNNLIVGITFAAVAEGFSLGAKSGIDPAELYKAIRGGWAGSKVLEVAAPAMLEKDFTPGGTVDIHWKDLGYALSLAKEQDVPTPMTALAHEVFKAARAAGQGGLSQPSVVKLWEHLPGIDVGNPG